MRKILEKLPIPHDANVLVGHAGSDDAGVYRLSDELALVLTVDFFTPVVDDPFDYGRVAATNSLSDVYAMGGRPIVALNIAGFPEKKIAPEILGEILRGGAAVAADAGVTIIGGHTVDDGEVKYGLAVVGTIHPDRIVTNAGARVGDVLVLTKPIGTGVLATALKEGKLDDEGVARLVAVMTQLNREASECMLRHGAHAATDITGFGLLGHAGNMARESSVTITIDALTVPLIDGATQGVRDGHLTGGGSRNRSFMDDVLRMGSGVDNALQHLFVDPQTAGGLLVAVSAEGAAAMVKELGRSHPQVAIVGNCGPKSDVALVVR